MNQPSLRVGIPEATPPPGMALDGRPVAIFGMARSGIAMAEFLVDKGAVVTVFDEAGSHDFILDDPFARAEDAAGGSDALRAPMPGLVKMVRVSSGDSVQKGQALLVLEAMKMEHTISAPHDGIVADIVAEGAQVTDGTVLVRFEETAAVAEPA